MPDQSSAASEHALIQEITAPLETLPEDPLAYVDADFPAAMRGYERHAVDDYVQRTRRLVAELQATRSPEAAVRRALERVGEQVSGILQRAHETAEQITAQSRSEGEDRLQQARREARQIVDAAERRARELDADTDRIWVERQRIVADAEELSGQLLGLARDAASRFPDDDARPEPVLDFEPAVDPVQAPELDEPGVDETVAYTPLARTEERTVPLPEPAADEPVADEPTVDESVADEPTVDEPGRAADDPETAADEPVADGPEPVADEPRPRRATDDDATHVIPPASEAAHRRQQG